MIFACLKISLLLVFISGFYSCDKRDMPPAYSKAKFLVSVKSSEKPLLWDSINYINAAGNKYSISRLNFYISGVRYKKADGTGYISRKVFYLDPATSGFSQFNVDSIPPGNYNEISFYLGPEPSQNKTLALGNALYNINMAWPDNMGGGYHFMKLEGHYLDTMNVKKGYAIHLGRNENLPEVRIKLNVNQKYWEHNYLLTFDVNQVFAGIYTYNLNVDPNYTMSDAHAMNKIKTNLENAFTLKQNN